MRYPRAVQFLRSRNALLLPFVLMAACGGDAPKPAAVPSTSAAPTVAGHSLDLAAMDRSVKPGADFYLYANGAWEAKAEIPPDRSDTGAIYGVIDEVDKRTRGLLEEAARAGAPAGSTAQKIGDFYASLVD